MENPKISIIIPMYNVQDYIEKCVNSILKQKYDNYEIIIVNDGSTDNSYNMVKSIDSSRIKIITKSNGGLSSARNEGLKYVTGEYIWFIDGDDYIEDDALELLVKNIKKEDYDVICFYYYNEYKGNKKIQVDKVNIKKLSERPLINTSACAKIFKKDFYEQNKFIFTEGIIYEDLALIPFVMAKANKIKLIEKPLYNYVKRENSIMNQRKKFNKNRDDKFKAIDILSNHFIAEGINEKYKEELEYLIIKHLLLVYSTEILPFKAEIYKERCKNVLKYLNKINVKWYENKYLKSSAKITRLYVWLFRKKLFKLCKISLKFKRR